MLSSHTEVCQAYQAWTGWTLDQARDFKAKLDAEFAEKVKGSESTIKEQPADRPGSAESGSCGSCWESVESAVPSGGWIMLDPVQICSTFSARSKAELVHSWKISIVSPSLSTCTNVTRVGMVTMLVCVGFQEARRRRREER